MQLYLVLSLQLKKDLLFNWNTTQYNYLMKIILAFTALLGLSVASDCPHDLLSASTTSTKPTQFAKKQPNKKERISLLTSNAWNTLLMLKRTVGHAFAGLPNNKNGQ